jgi:hypothetical protein
MVICLKLAQLMLPTNPSVPLIQIPLPSQPLLFFIESYVVPRPLSLAANVIPNAKLMKSYAFFLEIVQFRRHREMAAVLILVDQLRMIEEKNSHDTSGNDSQIPRDRRLRYVASRLS